MEETGRWETRRLRRVNCDSEIRGPSPHLYSQSSILYPLSSPRLPFSPALLQSSPLIISHQILVALLPPDYFGLTGFSNHNYRWNRTSVVLRCLVQSVGSRIKQSQSIAYSGIRRKSSIIWQTCSPLEIEINIT